MFLSIFCNAKVQKLRIGLLQNVTSFDIGLNKVGDLYIVEKNKKIKKIKIKENTKITYIDDDKIKFLGNMYKLPVELSSPEKILVNNRYYDGEIEILSSKDNKSLSVVNIIPLEQYLYGVVPYEIDSDFTDEMIKVQSIIARTYVVSTKTRHKEEGFDFCSAVHCQVYRGINFKNYARIKQLVDSTKGLVIVDRNGEPIRSYYHACCGGATDDVRDIWSTANEISYLKGVKCIYCKDSPHYTWEFKIEKDGFNKILSKNDINIGKIISIDVLDRTSNGRVTNLELIGSKEKLCFSANKFREIFGYNKVKSTKFTEIKIFTKELIISGKGWGHGVGLCQWGANGLTLQGKKFKQVIEYYYPGTKIKKIYE